MGPLCGSWDGLRNASRIAQTLLLVHQPPLSWRGDLTDRPLGEGPIVQSLIADEDISLLATLEFTASRLDIALDKVEDAPAQLDSVSCELESVDAMGFADHAAIGNAEVQVLAAPGRPPDPESRLRALLASEGCSAHTIEWVVKFQHQRGHLG